MLVQIQRERALEVKLYKFNRVLFEITHPDMEFTIFILAVFLLANDSFGLETNEAIKTQIKVLDPRDESEKLQFVKTRSGVESKVGNTEERIAADNGYGNPGDLIYRYRESNDVLQIREVIVLPEISSDIQEVQWYAVTPARRITSVRVLNFGRERAYTLRIDVAGNEAQAILRIPPNYDPRILIEAYGF
ncbi:uncharacterized protein [Euwallacea fornicatus]|uniref:uncharacterized protein isoform X2 n=1 Tax=Euwallacea fornicatus TaxID=995702 RepID=UPI00338F8AB4